MTGRNQFKRYRVILNIITIFLSLFPNWFNQFIWDRVSIYSGKFFVGIRYVLLKIMVKEIGVNVYIGKYVVLKKLDKLIIGDNVSIHDFSYIDAAGGLEIGNNVSIAHNCSILTTNHQWDDETLPIKYNKESKSKVIINNDVWLGCGVRVLAGVEIGTRSIIAAGAVVTKNVERRVIYGGVPAKKIKEI